MSPICHLLRLWYFHKIWSVLDRSIWFGHTQWIRTIWNVNMAASPPRTRWICFVVPVAVFYDKIFIPICVIKQREVQRLEYGLLHQLAFSALWSWFASHATCDVCFPPTAVCHYHIPLHPTRPQPAHHTGPPSFVMSWKWFDAPGEWASRIVCVYVTEHSRTEQCTVLAQSSRGGLD